MKYENVIKNWFRYIYGKRWNYRKFIYSYIYWEI